MNIHNNLNVTKGVSLQKFLDSEKGPVEECFMNNMFLSQWPIKSGTEAGLTFKWVDLILLAVFGGCTD